jgi:hypothetical protein
VELGMKALINTSGELVQIVHGLDGIDLTGLTVVDPAPEPTHEYEWDVPTQTFTPAPSIRMYQRMLDETVDQMRARYPAVGQYVTDEYRLTAEQALAFQQAGYSGPVPLAVDAWARAASITAQAAAEDILAKKALYEQMLLTTRDARLNGKTAIGLTTTPAAAKAAYDSVIAQLEATLPEPT